MNDLVTSYIRTIVPSIVSAAAAFLTARGFNLDQNALVGLTAFLTSLFMAVYYLAVRLFEKYASPKFGWLLGYAKAPTYTVKPTANS
jgi:hypothetical protein